MFSLPVEIFSFMRDESATLHIGYIFRFLEAIRTSVFMRVGKVVGELDALPRIPSGSGRMRVVVKAVWLKLLEPIRETDNLVIKMTPQAIGQSSVTWSQELLRAEDSKPLVQAGVVMVRVGAGGAQPFPDSYRNNYSHLIQKFQQFHYLPPTSISREEWQVPSDAFVTGGRIAVHHLDRNQHVNQSNYAELFHDSLVDYLTETKQGDLQNQIESLMLEYVTETHYGDQYRISLWPKTHSTGLLILAVMSIADPKPPILVTTPKKVGTILARINFKIRTKSQSKL